jgi:hypothetical protein
MQQKMTASYAVIVAKQPSWLMGTNNNFWATDPTASCCDYPE